MVTEEREQTRNFGCKGVVGNSTFETTKEDASVVDSSLTESKHDLENFDSPECSISRNNEVCTAGANHVSLSHNVGGSTQIADANVYTRYFVIKSLSRENIELSIEKGIWATQVMNEPILEEAFHNSDRVILIFSVNMSGYFQGYAQMMSSVSWKRDNLWSKSGGGNNLWGRTFKVKWLRLCDLPFQKTLHLKNPLNDFKPVKISRDCQELATDIGEALCNLFDGEVDMLGNMNSTSVDDVNYKRPCRSLPVHFEQENSMPFKHAQNVRWSNSSMSNPSLLYQQMQNEENYHHLMLGKPPKVPFHPNSNPYLKLESKTTSTKHPLQQNSGNTNSFQKHSSKKDTLPKEISSLSLSEEEFLSMTYEEYLQAFGRISSSSHSLPSSSHRTTSEHSRSR